MTYNVFTQYPQKSDNELVIRKELIRYRTFEAKQTIIFKNFTSVQVKHSDSAMNRTKKNLLCFGFIRECCNEMHADLLPNDVIALLILWLSFCDHFVANLSTKDIEIKTITNDKYGEYQQIKKANLHGFSSAICQNIIKYGDKQSWTFRINQDKDKDLFLGEHGFRRVVLGIIDDEVAIRRNKNITDFSDLQGGYGLYLSNMGKYFGPVGNYSVRTYFDYGSQYKLKEGDTIKMELDLTKEKGILRFTFDAQLNETQTDKEISNVFYDKIDINKRWRAAVAIETAAMVSLLP